MRTLTSAEIATVAGAGSCTPTPPSCEPTPPSCEPTPPTCPTKSKSKGNNGFGNGAFDGVPGHSGKTDFDR